eukprot:15330345-Ditylum_brightwellii.AAC.1
MTFKIGQKVWAKPAGRHGYHCASIVDEINNGEAFLLRWRKHDWNNSIVCARNMRPYVALMGLARTMHGVRYHNADMAGGVPH